MINEQSSIKTSVIDGILWGVVAYVCCVCGIVVEGGMADWMRIGPFEARQWMDVLAENDVDERAQQVVVPAGSVQSRRCSTCQQSGGSFVPNAR